MARERIEALLVVNDANITYLTGFPSQESWLLVGTRKCCYITDFRYILEARRALKNIPVKQYARSLFEAVGELADTWRIKRLGIDERHLSVSQYKMIKRHLPLKARPVKADNYIEPLREIKDQEELALINRALSIHKKALNYLRTVVKPGVTEKDVLSKLEQFVKSRDAGFSFDPIVASGPNSCYPHAKVTGRKLKNNEPVLIDMGIDVGGYKSDLTRMFFLGKIPNLVKRVNSNVFNAQRKAISLIKAGASIADIDQAARNSLEENGLAEYFGHALGHGVGLEIHEDPRLAPNNRARLREGMVVTVEPAVYIPKKFGIRIEDMVLVTKKGCKILSANID